MGRVKLFLLVALIACLAAVASCRPINIFSPLVDPSKMSNDAKMDAGYNAIANGDYDKAIDYFSDVIKSSTGDQLIDAYIGRAAAYMNQGAPGLSESVADMLSGEIEFDSPGDVIQSVKGSNDYVAFFDSISNAADDYNAAIDLGGVGMDRGILVEAYQANMMAATGVGSTTIAYSYNTAPWNIMDDAAVDMEIDAIVSADPVHPKNIDTWGASAGTNGLEDHVDAKPEEGVMLGYLQGAFGALKALEADPPLDMEIPTLKININNWVTHGLNEAPLT